MRAAASLAALLRRHRTAGGLTQEELAERASLSARAISDLERGVIRHPYPQTVRRLAQALRLDAREAAELQRVARGLEGGGDESARAVRAAGVGVLLPTQPTPFIGRRQEVEEVMALLLRDDIRLLTLTGVGGVGKTRLALRVAEDAQEAFPDGVVFVSLAALADPGLVPSTMASALGHVPRGDQPPQEWLVEHLQDTRLLVLLDNFEHLLPAATVVSCLLTSCPQLTVLVTSRTVLHLSAEHEYLVPSLATPVPSHLPDFDALARFDAVQLFLHRVRAVQPGFAMTEGNAGAIAEICFQLDGLPLAIELAAARVRLFSPRTLLTRLSDRLGFLTGGPSDVPARQQTLRRTIDWSYELLPPEAQALLARLSVFAGGCTLEAAEAVCNSGRVPDFLEGMTALVEHSLLRAEEHDDTRFAMLDTIRAYATERLRDSGEADAVRQRHATYYSQLARRAERELHGAEQRLWLRHLDDELENLRAALTWLRDRGDVNGVLETACSLALYWRRRGYLAEGCVWLEAGLSGNLETPRSGRARRLLSLGRLASFRNDHERATAALAESVDLFRALGDKRGAAWALAELGNAAESAHEAGANRSQLEESLKLFAEVGDERGRMVALRWLGAGAIETGAVERGERLLTESAALARQLNDAQALAMALCYRSRAKLALERYREAEELLREAVLLVVELGDTVYILDCLELLACAVGCQGATQTAAAVLASVGTTRAEMDVLLPPAMGVAYHRWHAAARARADEKEWNAAWERGVGLSLEEALAEVSDVTRRRC